MLWSSHLNKEKPVDVKPEDGREVYRHGHYGEQPVVEHKLIHQVSVDVQHYEEAKLEKESSISNLKESIVRQGSLSVYLTV